MIDINKYVISICNYFLFVNFIHNNYYYGLKIEIIIN